jgi:hypothetical protein
MMPKDEGAKSDDAFASDDVSGRAAIADGVSGGIFSGDWARLLTHSVVESPPPVDDAGPFHDWLTARRAEWREPIDRKQAPWNVLEKLRTVGGQSTLLWMELIPDLADDAEGYRLRAVAIGDCCLFHLRDGELLGAFPLTRSEDFNLTPAVLTSLDSGHDWLSELRTAEYRCLPGDLIVLCTDAIACWALSRQEQGQPVRWQDRWDLSLGEWHAEILSLRAANEMRVDDSTVALLRVIPDSTEEA